ncbi:MAG: hypothetical protein ACE5Q6_00855 [Dehalococcoidia bacterium]
MPAKGCRIASRQAQLGRRKRRQGRPGEGSIDAPSTVVPMDEEEAEQGPAVGDEQGEAVATQTRTATATANAPTAGRGRPPTAGRVRSEIPMAYTHLGKELRRIFVMSGILLIVLIVLSIFI